VYRPIDETETPNRNRQTERKYKIMVAKTYTNSKYYELKENKIAWLMDRMTIETDPFGTFAVMPSSDGYDKPIARAGQLVPRRYMRAVNRPTVCRVLVSCEGNREHGCICIHMLAVNRLFEKTDMSKANRQPASPPPAGPAPLEVETIEAQAVNVCWLLAAVVAMQIAAKDAPVQLPRKPARPDRPRPASPASQPAALPERTAPAAGQEKPKRAKRAAKPRPEAPATNEGKVHPLLSKFAEELKKMKGGG
jgi:hypothetical protein